MPAFIDWSVEKVMGEVAEMPNQIVRSLVKGVETKYPGIRVQLTGGRDLDLLVKITAEVKARSHVQTKNPTRKLDLARDKMVASMPAEELKDMN